MSKYFVYTHTIEGKQNPFFVGKGTKRVKGKTHKSQYHRAYSAEGRNSFWHDIVSNKTYSVEIVYESSSETSALDKEKALKKKYGMKRTIKYGWGNNKYKKGNGCLVNVQEHEHRTNKCTGKVCPFCDGRSVWKGENKNEFYCSGISSLGFCEGTEGWVEIRKNGWEVIRKIDEVDMGDPIPVQETIEIDFFALRNKTPSQWSKEEEERKAQTIQI